MSVDSWCLIQQTKVLPRSRWKSWIFHQDKDSKHTCKSTQEWLKRGVDKNPDLNLICGELKSVTGERNPANVQEAWTNCRRVGENVPAGKRNKLVDGCKRHLEAVTASKGCATKYLGGVPWLLPVVSFSVFSWNYKKMKIIFLVKLLWTAHLNNSDDINLVPFIYEEWLNLLKTEQVVQKMKMCQKRWPVLW